MITPEKQKWLDSLSDKIITIVPYDPRSERLFEGVKKKIISVLGPDALVEHCGASSLGISGQDEIDVDILAEREKFAEYVPLLESIFTLGKVHPGRVRFKVEEEGKKIDLQLIDMNHPDYLESRAFEDHLRSHPENLERYRIFKESCNGLTTKEYYQRKVEFIDEILNGAKAKINEAKREVE